MDIVKIIIIVYIAQVLISSIINLISDTRIPINLLDFLKLTWLPYVLLNLKEIKRIKL
jgi:hypothetical protein